MSVPPSAGSPSDRTYHRALAPRKALGLFLALGAAAGWWALWRRPARIEVSGDSMRPVLEAGDWALALRRARIERGTVVVVEHPERPGFEMVKRVVAVPGDLTPDGRVLGPEEVWVEGDAPESSTDSRSFGPVPRERVKGVVRLVYWPWDRRRRIRAGRPG